MEMDLAWYGRNSVCSYSTKDLAMTTRRDQIEKAAIIKTTNNFEVIVDKEDLDNLSKHKWYASSDGYTHYALTTLKLNGRGKTGKPKYKRISIHRMLLNAKKGQIIDHINRNGLDNRKANLRFCTIAQNTMNSVNKTLLRGVFFIKDEAKIVNGNRWQAAIRENGKTKILGVFKNPIDAAIEWDIAARHHHKEFANLNFKRIWEWADENPISSREFDDYAEQVYKLEQKLAIAWNALQEVIESGMIDCQECLHHEAIVEQALKEIEAVGK